MFQNRFRWVLAIFTLLIFSANGFAQGATYGQISGTVTDSAGAVVQGASV